MMGVMQCDRRECRNVCCDFMIMDDYICSSCNSELEKWRETWDENTKVSEVAERIREFMNSEPGYYTHPPDSSDPADVEAEWERLKAQRLRD